MQNANKYGRREDVDWSCVSIDWHENKIQEITLIFHGNLTFLSMYPASGLERRVPALWQSLRCQATLSVSVSWMVDQ